MVAATRLDDRVYQAFATLFQALEVEHISADGQRTAEEVESAVAEIRRQWTLLEEALGREVPQDEVLAWLNRQDRDVQLRDH